MGYINPIFNEPKIINDKKVEKKVPESKVIKPSKPRAIRKDKTHNIKFPVSPMDQMKLRSYCQQAKRINKLQRKEPITQTKFNTLILSYGLKHKEILSWTQDYNDSKKYMHTNILETEYDIEIGGPFGLAIQKNLSDRKVVFHIIHSVLQWLEGGGNIEKII
jgi:hypothetical protein